MSSSTKHNFGRNSFVLLRFRCLFLIPIILVVTSLIFLMSNGADIFLVNNNVNGYPWKINQQGINSPDDVYTIKTEGCTIPGLKPFDATIKKFIAKPKNIKSCDNAKFALLEYNNTNIWIVREHLAYYQLSDSVNISCCYRPFYRPLSVSEMSLEVDDRVQYLPCIYFYDMIEVKDEFVRVTCYSHEKIVYEQFFPFAPKKSLKATMTDHEVKSDRQEMKYNVIILGVDAISRLNFYRTMPKTLAYLKRKGAIELKGYNKVGDNTFPNLIPMLLGIKETDLKKTCWPNERVTFDKCPFIWDLYRNAGFFTAFGEDTASLGTFNFEKLGFGKTPTDYYLHTFVREAETHSGNNRDFNSYICMGNKYFYKVLLDYIQNLISSMGTSRLFGFFWEVTMSHDYLNYPLAMDDEFDAFFKNLDSLHILNSTIFILLSDHGMRWGDIRFTKQGRLEERLPLNYILLPPSFQEQYSQAYRNIKSNSLRLTTPFDVYATLLDLVNLRRVSDKSIKMRSEDSTHNRGISLFLPIPGNRTCRSAAIDEHWCTCHRGMKVATTSTEASNSAGYLIWHLNTLLKHQRQCARLSLAEILEVTELVSGTPAEGEDGWREYLTVVRTAPGDAVFEATLRHGGDGGGGGGGWTVAGTVSRLNLYGEQSRCVHDYRLKLYCFCM